MEDRRLSMRIQPAVQQGLPSPSLLCVLDEICAATTLNELLFVLAKWMDVSFEEPVWLPTALFPSLKLIESYCV